MTETATLDDPVRDAKAGRPKDPAKRAALVAAAQSLFMDRGFEATSIDAIAHAAGVAKVTVYSHFSSKEALFAEAIRAKCDSMIDVAALSEGAHSSVHERLKALAGQFFILINDPEAVAVHRLVASEGERVPEIAEIFFNTAIMNVCSKVARVLTAEHNRGALQVSDPDEAAGHFLALIKGMPMLRRELHMPAMTPDELEAHIDSAVGVFERAYSHH
jgi:TetR/AcrR family transcriptional regulator, mexJK operon transcriptional repressor